MNGFDEFPPELMLRLSPFLSIASLNSLVLTCHRLHEILRSDLESRITPDLGRELLLWAVTTEKLPIVRKLLSHPHSIKPVGFNLSGDTLLHIAVDTGNTTIASLLLQAGADPTEWTDRGPLYECQPLHWAATKEDLEMMKVLLDHNAPLDTQAASAGCSETVLQMACSMGHLEMVKLLLGYGANTECVGHYGTALGFALHSQPVNLDIVKMLLANGADASVEVPVLLRIAPPPRSANLLYLAMELPRPITYHGNHDGRAKWEGLPLPQEKKHLMAMLLAHGASEQATLATISNNLIPLARAAKHTGEEYLATVKAMLTEAENWRANLSAEIGHAESTS